MALVYNDIILDNQEILKKVYTKKHNEFLLKQKRNCISKIPQLKVSS